MAIPTMSDSSRLTEVSALAYLDEGTSASDTECGDEPELQPRALGEPQPVAAEDTGISDVTSRGERGLMGSREDANHFLDGNGSGVLEMKALQWFLAGSSCQESIRRTLEIKKSS